MFISAELQALRDMAVPRAPRSAAMARIRCRIKRRLHRHGIHVPSDISNRDLLQVARKEGT